MNNFKFLLIGTSLSFIPLTVNAQCVATQDCETLGYTETTCNGGKGVKCPFGNKWACLGANEEECKQKFCDEYGFTLTCTGTGYAGGAGVACGGKYAQCTCASGYEWKDGSCQKETPTEGVVGDLYYCNGAVVAVKAPEMDFFVAMQDLGSMTWDSANRSCQNYLFCGNFKGTMPSKDQLVMMYNNKSSLNSLLSAHGGIKLTEEDPYWSSTTENGTPYYVFMSNGSVYPNYTMVNNLYARPVLVNY